VIRPAEQSLLTLSERSGAGVVPDCPPFVDNAEFLAAKSREAMLLLTRASLARQDPPAERAHHDGLRDAPAPDGGAVARASEPRTAETVEREFDALRREHQARMTASDPDVIPFLSLVQQFHLDTAAQDILWLLFFHATSTDFRRRFEELRLGSFADIDHSGFCAGDLLSVLYPGDYARQLAGRSLFASEGPLMGRYLIRMPYGINNRFSVLEIPVVMAGRIIHWITADQNQYDAEMPFLIERPETGLSQVVLPEALLQTVLKHVEHYDAFVQLRKSLGLDDVVQYGRAMVILEHGPPGTGKTLLARALSRHTGRPLVMMPPDAGAASRPFRPHQSPSNTLNMLFREGQLQNGIVFIDECEWLCMEDSPQLKDLLLELERSEALVIMTTNRPEVLAPAIDRRITLKVPFTVPAAALRRKIWDLLLPDTVPLANDVDLDALARTYPFAGGYIKNAVLTAIHFALSRGVDGNLQLTQADLEEAARLQERHVGYSLSLRRVRTPRLRFKDCVMSAPEVAHLEALARTARHYAGLMERWGWPQRRGQATSRGLKVLFSGYNFEAALESAEALAGELGVRVEEVPIQRIFSLPFHQAHQNSDMEVEVFRIADLFSSAADGGNILLLNDERGQLGRMDLDDAADTVYEFFYELAAFGGTVLVVTRACKVALPAWANVFHDTLCFGKPDTRARAVYWRRALDSAIPLAGDVCPERLAAAYELTFGAIQDVVHKACLIKAAEEPDGPLDAATIDQAVRYVQSKRAASGPLFG